jgi:hypothetical protein
VCKGRAIASTQVWTVGFGTCEQIWTTGQYLETNETVVLRMVQSKFSMQVRASRPLAEPREKISAALFLDNVHPVSASVSAGLLHRLALPKLRAVTAPIPSVSPFTNRL